MDEHPAAATPPRSSRDRLADLSRRDALKLAGVAGAAALAPALLSSCKPAPPLPGPPPPDAAQRGRSFVGSPDVELLQGAWCWFQMPRGTMGPNGQLWLGSQAAASGGPVDGNIQATRVDLNTMTLRENRIVQNSSDDDHVSPSVLALGDQVHVAWALHRRVDHLEAGLLAAGVAFQRQRIRRPGSLTAPGRGMSYASVHLVNGALWMLYRGEQFSWNLLTSPDAKTWTAHGLVVAPPVAGQRPYLQAASTGKALTITVTDGNPTEFPGTSLYAGSVGADLKVRNSAGTVVGSVGTQAPKPAQLTRLLTGVAGELGEADDVDHWMCDLQHVDNAPTGILSTRDPWPTDGSPTVRGYRHRYHWIRKRAAGWVVEPLGWAGSELASNNPDYAGLGAQDPTDPRRVVVSTNVHPETGLPLDNANTTVHHFELFEGYRVGEGRWTWTQLTSDSTEDNLRPIIVAGGAHKALAWMRGTYWSWTDANTRLVVRRAGPPA